MSWTGSVIATSGTVASVVATLVIRFGACRVPSGSGSLQVSLMWTLYPSQPLPCFSQYRASRS